jgi:hypothetical protein
MKLNLLSLGNGGGVGFFKLEYLRKKVITEEEVYCPVWEGDLRLSDRIGQLFKQVKPYRNAPIIIIGGIPKAEVVELSMQRLNRADLAGSLEFELSPHLPGNFADMVWYGRTLPEFSIHNDKVTICCCVMLRVEWEELLEELSAVSYRFDYWLHPLVEVPALARFEEVYYPETETDFMLSQNIESESSDILPSVWRSNEDVVQSYKHLKNTGALAVAERYFRYGEKGLIKKLASPPHLKIRRSRFLQTAAIILFLVAMVFGSLGLIMWVNERRRHYEAVSSALADAEAKLSRQRWKNLKNLKLQKHFQDLFKQYDECKSGPGRTLAGFARLLPKESYVTDISGYNSDINLTLKRTGGNDGFAALKRSKIITPVSVRKHRNRDGSQYIYMKLAQKTSHGGKHVR